VARWWPVVGLVSGCAWLSDEELARYADRDGDGEPGAPFGRDCDDSDPEVNPRTQLDPGGATAALWPDADGDGVGAGSETLASCVLLPTYAVAGGDCDDTDPTIGANRQQFEDRDEDGFGVEHGAPGGCEAAPGFSLVSGDCDDGDPTAHPGVSWFEDADGDGFGAEPALADCAPPPVEAWRTLVDRGGDCDDASAEVHPRASDVALDGLDQDCAGDTDLDGDADGAPDFATDVACAIVDAAVVSDTDGLRAALDGPAGSCVHVALQAGVYSGGLVITRPTTIAPASPGAEVVFRPAGAGTVQWGFQNGQPLTLDRVRLEQFEEGAVQVVAQTPVLLGNVTLVDGVGLREADARGGPVPPRPHTLRLLGVDADGVSPLAWLPSIEWDRVELTRVRSRGAVSVDPLLHLRGDELELAHLEVSQCAVTTDLALLEATGAQDASTDVTLDDVRVRDCLVDGAVSVRGEYHDAPPSVTVDDLVVEDTVFLASLRSRVALDVLGVSELRGIELSGVEVESRELGDASLVSVESGSLVVGLRIQDATFASRGNLLLASPAFDLQWRNRPLELQDAALAVGGGDVHALAIDGAAVEVEDSTLVRKGGPAVARALGSATFTRVAFVNDTAVAQARIELTDSVFTGPVPTCGPTAPCCLTGCRRIADPGFLRYGDPIAPALWDLRLTAGAGAPCDRPVSALEEEGVGAFRRDTTALGRWYPDRDGDGLLDDWEERFLGRLAAAEPGGDPDGDGLSNRCEQDATGTLPDRADIDEDGLPDGADPSPWGP
jgi:hypothetical protein